MTDKQVIIDGERIFECVWCKYDFKESNANFILSENPNECVCRGCMTEWADNLLWDFKRKEQECEELKKKLHQQLDQLKAENEKLIRKITEIFACLIKANRSGIITDTIWISTMTTLWDDIAQTLGIEGDQVQVEEQILQKISKSEVKNAR